MDKIGFLFTVLSFCRLPVGMIWRDAGRSGTAWSCTGTPLMSAVSVKGWEPLAFWWTARRERLAACRRAAPTRSQRARADTSFFSLWAAAGGRPGDLGPGHLLHSVPVDVGTHPHCPGAVLPARPQVQHQKHPLEHSGGHVFVRARVSPGDQPDRTAGNARSCTAVCNYYY